MPTATKLLSALIFAGLGWVLASFLVDTLTVDFTWKRLPLVVVIAGLYLGWQFVGVRARDGFRAALSAGLTAAVLVLVFTVLASGFATMMERALNKRYRGLMTGLEEMFGMIGSNFVAVARADVAVIVVVGGLLGGLIAGIVARFSR